MPSPTLQLILANIETVRAEEVAVWSKDTTYTMDKAVKTAKRLKRIEEAYENQFTYDLFIQQAKENYPKALDEIERLQESLNVSNRIIRALNRLCKGKA